MRLDKGSLVGTAFRKKNNLLWDIDNRKADVPFLDLDDRQYQSILAIPLSVNDTTELY